MKLAALAICALLPVLASATFTDLCTEAGAFRVSYDVTCSLYYTCTKANDWQLLWTKDKYACPYGLIFNPTSGQCERWAHCISTICWGSSQETVDDPNALNKLAPTTYIKCNKDEPVVKKCPVGFVFKSELGKCIVPL